LQDRIKREKEILEAKKSLRKQGAKAVADKTVCNFSLCPALVSLTQTSTFFQDKNVNAAVIKAREAQREREKQREIDRLQKEVCIAQFLVLVVLVFICFCFFGVQERERLAKFETDRQNKLKQKEEERKKLEAEKKRLDEESKKAKSDAQQAEASRAAERKAALMKQKANAENSRVGEHLSEKTTRRVIVMVLAMLFGVPALESSVVNPSEQNGLDYLTMLADTNGTTWGTFNAAINQYQSFNSLNQWHLIAIRIQGKTFGNTSLSYINTFQPLTDFRDTELIFLTSTNAMGGTNIATFDVSSNARLSGAYGVLLTLAVVILLAVGSALFSSDADAIVITPIKRMIDVIEAMKRNPLARIGTGATGDAKKIAKEKAAKLQALNIPFFTHPWEATKMFFMKLFGYVKVPDDALEGETDILEQTLQKLSGLLQVGFGEAGASIIQRNLGDGELNAMVEGERKLAIFGFCDVRHFADITQCLQGDIFLFVNTVAEIVHSEVSRCQGAANKNIGEAFLVAWKLPKDLLEEDLDLVVNSGADSTEVACLPAARRNAIDQSRVLVDKALTAFLRVILRVAASEELRNFGKNAAIKAVFGNDFQVSMGFGLHVGWAIEGAIGSTYKIDASYLSPNVNMAARLEAATRQFNVPLLLSGPFHSLLTPKHAEKCRRIDIVKVKGSAQPMPLYCFDIFPKLIDELRPPVEPILSDELTQHIRNNADGLRKPHAPERVYSHILYLLDHKLMSTHASFTADSTDVTIQPIDWEKDPQLSVLQSGFNRTFFDVFAGGVEEYLRGDWPAAEQTLQEVMDKHKPNDGPTQVLLNYMRNRNCTAPADWDGCRALTSK
jgi:class 3 adenylate cyclase